MTKRSRHRHSDEIKLRAAKRKQDRWFQRLAERPLSTKQQIQMQAMDTVHVAQMATAVLLACANSVADMLVENSHWERSIAEQFAHDMIDRAVELYQDYTDNPDLMTDISDLEALKEKADE